MEKIPSFTVNHLVLEPGIYTSRIDEVNGNEIITYDLRLTRPNIDAVMETGEVHTIEHIGATYLRNHPHLKEKIIYFGPMGCRTGFYLITAGNLGNHTLYSLVHDTFAFIEQYEGEIPGATPRDCGNYSDQNLARAKHFAAQYVKDLEQLDNHSFAYKEE